MSVFTASAQADSQSRGPAVDLDSYTIDSETFNEMLDEADELGNVPSDAYHEQAESQMLADLIQLAVQEHELAGFTTITVEPDLVTVYWSGDIPAEIVSIIDDSAVDVRIEFVDFSADELNEAKRELFENPPSGIPGEITNLGTSDDGNGITVGVESFGEISVQEEERLPGV